MYKISLLIFMLTLLVLSGCSLSTSKNLDLNEIHMKKQVHGITEYKMNLENAIEKYSDHMVLGKVVSLDKLNNSRDVYKVKVNDTVLGDTPEEILVYAAEKNILDINKEYLLFISDFSSNLYDKDFYVLNEEFVIKVQENGDLKRLKDVFKKTYVPPFIDDKYNNYQELKKHIQSNYKKDKGNGNGKKAIDKLSEKQLIAKADHIIKIKVTNITTVNNGLALVDYAITNAYKNGNLRNNHSLLLPNILKEGKEYLIFLNNREKDPESVTLTTRQNSIFEEGSKQYKSIVKSLK